MKTDARAETGDTPLYELPLVYISYDEPWAEDGFAEIRRIRPDAKHVHGVKGLNACHVAAAEEAGSDWFLSVDADTTLLPAFLGASISTSLMSPNFQPFWPSRNVVNGIISGNGSVKLWSRDLVLRMRSHEAAPKGRVSLDSDIPLIEPGVTRLVPMPGCLATVDPARTAFHAFRAGFRETYFLSWLREKLTRRGAFDDRTLIRILGIWGNIGRHARNGPWLLYGARLGMWASIAWRNFEPAKVNDYEWFEDFWTTYIVTRIGPGGERCSISGQTYNPDRLAEEIHGLGRVLNRQGPVPMAEIDADQSALMASAGTGQMLRSPHELTQVGKALADGIGVDADRPAARAILETAALLGDPNAMAELGRYLSDDHKVRADTLLRAAVDLGSAAAPYHLAKLLEATAEPRKVNSEIEDLLDLSVERGFKMPEVPA